MAKKNEEEIVKEDMKEETKSKAKKASKTTTKKTSSAKTGEKKASSTKAATKKTSTKKAADKKTTTAKKTKDDKDAIVAEEKKTPTKADKKAEVAEEKKELVKDNEEIKAEKPVAMNTETKETVELDSNNKEKTNQLFIWFGLLAVVIAAMFGVNHFFPNDYQSQSSTLDQQVDMMMMGVQIDVSDEEKDGTVAKGDIIVIDYVGTMDGKEFDGGSQTGARSKVGEGLFIDGFEDSIIGSKKGDTVTSEITFPTDYAYTEYQGKKATFKITIKNVYKAAEINDATVEKYVNQLVESGTTSVQGIKTEKELRAFFSEYIQSQQEQQNAYTTEESQ
ncbi:FKBP-type peptidyl-prolyl cis-trans isomerase [Erysipelotrichaceae bacterium OttesenSCG-928-M19]|nr:FKBP-type peptidyl-prolyl cis-trans isomerase [Erysipelotrichaceae bacterium OttesenSCG-928-M19]